MPSLVGSEMCIRDRSRPLPTIQFDEVEPSTMLFEFRVRHSEFTFLYHPSAALEVRCATCASSTFNIAYLADHPSCRSCLRRYCALTSLQSLSQSEVSYHSVSAFSSICKLPPGSVVPSRIVAEPSHILFASHSATLQYKPSLCICSRSSIVSTPVV